MSLIGLSSPGESGSSLLNRIRAHGLEVETGRNTASSLAYSANGLVLRQKETVVTTEYRGLTADAAKKLEELDRDETGTTIYYKAIGLSHEFAAVAITTGTKIDYMPRRDDEGDAWVCIKTEVEYSAGQTDGWSTTRPQSSSTGVQVSKDMRKSLVWDSLYAVETTTVTEYRFLTKAEADTKVSQNTSNGVEMHAYKKYTQETEVGAWCYAQCGTNKTASARYVNAENGYTVTVTQSDFSAEGTNWHYS